MFDVNEYVYSVSFGHGLTNADRSLCAGGRIGSEGQRKEERHGPAIYSADGKVEHCAVVVADDEPQTRVPFRFC
jgi:hypothetical protein